MEKKSVIMAFNDQFLLPAIVSIYSLFINNKGIDLYILHNGLSNKSRLVLKRLEKCGFDNIIKFVLIEEDDLSKIKVATGRWGVEAFFRYFAPDILENVDKMLWIDADTYIRLSIDEIFNEDLGDKTFAAVLDPTSDPIGRLGIVDYVNTGVILMNAKKIRDNHMMGKFWNLVENENYHEAIPDQDAFNMVFGNEIKTISSIWNMFPFYYNINIEYYLDNSVIVHFISKIKPWNMENVGYYQKSFDRFPTAKKFVTEYWQCMEKAVTQLEN